MCQNATKTAASLMTAIEPTLVNLLTVLGIATTPDGQAAITAYQAAEKAVAAWQPGTTAQDVIQVIDAFTQVFNTLPIPADAKTLADIISAGIVTVIGVLSANSPSQTAPSAKENDPVAGEAAAASPEEITGMHQAHVIADTTAKVTTLVPEFKRSIFTSPAHQYKNAWNKRVEVADPKYASLKV